MKQITTMRKTVALWDRRIAQNWLAKMEAELKKELLELGCPKEVIAFSPIIHPYRSGSAVYFYTTTSKAWISYETAILHPSVEVLDAETLIIPLEREEVIDTIELFCYAHIRVALSEEAKQTLVQIGKIKYDAGFSSPPSLVLACDL